jgi:Zn-dependent metalloprotease/Ca2+-binding RTX toxin-like protein
MRRTRRLIVLFALFVVAQPMVAATGAAGPTAAAGSSETSAAPGLSQRTIRALRASADGKVFVSTRRSTGVAGFVRVERNGDLLPASAADASRVKSDDFLAKYGEAFGIRDTSQLKLTSRFTDELGATHLTYEQSYRGVPVFGAVLKVHLDAANRLTAVNGVYIPDISVGTTARLSASQAVDRAIAEVVDHPPTDESGQAAQVKAADLSAESTMLLVYRTGLLRDVRGANQLAYEVVVTNGSSIREFIYVHANAGKIMNRYSGVDNALHRVVYERSAATPPIWEEGQAFPGSLNQDQQNIVLGSGEAYYLFLNAFGRDSYDAAGAFMRTVNNDPTISCPNANWNGATTNYCNGVTADDVVVHEWGHAYTQYTHDLIYQWQSGALNEAYSDIWGETADSINGRGTDTPNAPRTAGGCTSHTLSRPFVMINSPASIAGFCTAGAADFGPQLGATGPITGNVTLGNDGTGVTSDACTALVGFPAGNIALVDRGTCGFTVKVKNAQNAGAIGVLVADNVWGPADPMAGADPTITIPSVRIPLGIGNTIKGQLGTGVNVTMRIDHASPQDTYRWDLSEDATAFGSGVAHAIRDMWNPRCVSDPGRVTDAEYFCATTDGGGVHTNSGVPNHGYALLVDGGTYNGHTIGSIGLVKAAHLYFRAQLAYQTPTTDFVDHADALVAACADLVGEQLNGLSTSPTPAPPGQPITPGDCTQVSEMIAAVELRTDPASQCNFQPILQPGDPPMCGEQPAAIVYEENFEDGLTGWTLTNQGVFAGWPGYNWVQDTSLPGGRAGAAAFAVDPLEGNCDGAAGDVSGVQRMQSPVIALPAASSATTSLTFDHYVATEAGWDGGNVKISVNGGPFTIVPDAAYTFNPYNATLQTAAAGNTNPLQGQRAWSGTDGGSLFSTWGESQINLGALGVVGGSTIQLRFDFGNDGCTGIDGWYVDDVTVYLCTPPKVKVVAGGNADSDTVGTMNLEVEDAETPEAALVLSGSSSNTALVPNSGITFGGSGANRTVTIRTTSAVGTAVVTVTVTDLEGKTASVPITVQVGGNGANTLTGTAGADLFFGRNGGDVLSGLAGNDLASGGKGDDTINGGPDDDTMFGGQGNDGLTGGTGADGFHGGQGTDTAADFNAGEGDTRTGIP